MKEYIIQDKLYKEIEQYCKINDITDINQEINSILQIGFNVIRYGTTPFSKPQIETVIETSQQKEENEVKPQKKRGRKPKVVEEPPKEESKPVEETVLTKRKVRIIKSN